MGEELSSQLATYDGGLTILLPMSVRQVQDAEAGVVNRERAYLFSRSTRQLEIISHNERHSHSNKELEPSKAASHPSMQTHIFISICLDELKMEIIFLIVHLYYFLLICFWHKTPAERTLILKTPP